MTDMPHYGEDRAPDVDSPSGSAALRRTADMASRQTRDMAQGLQAKARAKVGRALEQEPVLTLVLTALGGVILGLMLRRNPRVIYLRAVRTSHGS